jgi:hypothetical protein
MDSGELNLMWIQEIQLLEKIRDYFIHGQNQHPNVEIHLVSTDRPIVWAVQESNRVKVVDQPLEFFINAQIHSTQDPELLIESVCHTLGDVCRSWAIGSTNPRHYITFRVPHILHQAPSGTIQLTIISSVCTEIKDRQLFLKVDGS